MLNVTGSGDSVQESDVELTLVSLWVAVFTSNLSAAVIWSGTEGFALFLKVACSMFVGTASYDSLSSVNAAVRLH